MRIGGINGGVEITGKAALAPMAGVADRAFRRICVEYGAAYVVGEMVSSKGLNFGDRKSAELLELGEEERPAAVQLFGDDPEQMARAARLAMGGAAGCHRHQHVLPRAQNRRQPLRQRLDAGAGALPADRPRGGRGGRGTGDRKPQGIGRDEVNAVEVAQACAAGGAAAITVHGRTREQMYAPPVDWEIIRRVKEAVDIPVIGNGDVTSAAQAAALYEQTGCDLVMVGRGALGAPWLFAQINAYLQEGRVLPDPPVAKRMAVLLRQISLAVAYKGERVAMREARKHAAWYMRGLRGAAGLRARAGTLETFDDLRRLCEAVMQENARQEAT